MRDAVGASRCAARPQRRWLQRCAAAAAAPPAVATPPQAADHDGAVRAARLRGAGPGLALYDPAALEAEFGGAPLAVAARLADASSRLGAVLLRLAGDWATGSLGAAMRTRASELRTALTRLGPAAVKLGQLLSTRPDLLPGPYLEELARLQDALPGFPDAQAFELIEAELGAPLPALYRRITAKPIAAASLGQVYKAELLDGTPVAVKVQRPGLAYGVRRDFFLIRQACRLLDARLPGLATSLTAACDEFGAKIFGELDYVAEGLASERFARLYASPAVAVPAIVWERTSSRVLTLAWVDGVKLSDGPGLRARGLDVLQQVDAGIQCSLAQLLQHGYFHADPHPGNLLAAADGRLAFIDFGIMAEMPEEARHAVLAHIVHLVNRDYDEMARDYYRLGFLPTSVDVSPIVPALAAFFDDVLAAPVAALNFKTIVDGLGELLYTFPFDVPPYYALVLRSLTVLEGLALSTDPSFRLIGAAYPFVARRLLVDPAPALRAALAELLFRGGAFRWDRLEDLLRQAGRSPGVAALAQPQPPAAAAARQWDDVAPALWDLLLGPDDGEAAAAAVAAEAGGGGGALGARGAHPPPPSDADARLRALTVTEAARCCEAFLAAPGEAAAAAASGGPLGAALRGLLGGGGGAGAGAAGGAVAGAAASAAAAAASSSSLALVSPAEAAQMADLRRRLARVAALLAPPAGGPSQPGGDGGWWGGAAAGEALRLARQPRARAFAAAVGGQLASRALARAVRVAATATLPQPPSAAALQQQQQQRRSAEAVAAVAR